jgi:Icc protein
MPTRRDVVKAAAAGLLAGEAGGAAPAAAARRGLRVAHLTDVHVQPELGAAQGLRRCLEHACSRSPRPDLILNGGDSIMDAFNKDEARTRAQWAEWHAVLKDFAAVPIRHCVGNHDVWGWKTAGLTGAEPRFGKAWALEAFGLEERFYRFEQGGWRFLVLDSTFRTDAGYTARLDEPQFEWLRAELAAAPPTQPIAVLSHIPILCGCAFLDGDNEKSGNWVVPGAWMHTDARRIKDLFHRHRNVRAALSGHIHLRDRLDYNGVTYYCNGAVSGGWWKGDYQETGPGYALVDLYDDGSSTCEYLAYG